MKSNTSGTGWWIAAGLLALALVLKSAGDARGASR